MADFCKQCSIETFGKDFEDMKGLVTEGEYGEGYVANVLCEGCGNTQVNPKGECVSRDCLCQHGIVQSATTSWEN